ncbi:MAG: 2-oxoacid:acceptor oxidoreductase subunit alpha [Candidatus Heimdallarchaeota archaeon]|nr:MAG: 2-oxoacid:acceptor oxidoreductase subunit alpha [Candidatus Heimdallarchaeota archaeon]
MTSFSLTNKKDISIVLCGAAGQGIQTVEKFLTHVLHEAGYNIAASKEYMSRVRGGTNSTEIRISSNRVKAFVDRIDIFIPFNKTAISRQRKRITKDTLIIGEPENILHELDTDEYNVIEISWTKIAEEIGNRIYSNTIAAGVITEFFKVDKEFGRKYLRERFARKGDEIINKNIEAFQKGSEVAEEIIKSKGLEINIKPNQEIAKEIMVNGASIVGMGAIAGGCNFICSYPMSPSTGVLVFLANHSNEFDILVEQAEDEIAAINAGLGAAYAGARAMVTTSGGGFALMGEGLSLSGMIETPIVIHIAQRPGPATGLPTRTEQGDLELALYSGHGDFPRIILAPGTLEDAFYVTQKAFNLADQFQVPVIILTDQFFVDLYYNLPSLDLSNITIDKHIIKTEKTYQRYKLTKNGISPRGIPGFGEGLVRADSDEHDEDGFITEDLETTRVKMVEKRLNRLEEVKKNVIPPDLIGGNNYETLVIGWGSTYTAITEALEEIGDKNISFLHYKQVYPLHPKTKDYLEKAKKLIIIENNITSQFGKLIKLYTGLDIENKILKFTGMPFSVEELTEEIKKVVEGKK